MTFSVRLSMTPSPAVEGGAVARVTGLVLGLLRRGPVSSQIALEGPKPAEIALSARLFESALPGADSETRELGTLRGSLELTGQGRGLRFDVEEFVPDPSLPEEPEEDPSANKIELLRELKLGFSAAFRSKGELDLTKLRVKLPVRHEETFRHAEVSAELTIGGAAEAAPETNDLLDVPLAPRPVLQVRLVDEIGEPLTGQKLKFCFGERELTLTTDGDGAVRIENPPDASAKLEIVELESVRSELKSRWDAPRKGPRLHAAPGTLAVLLPDVPEAFEIEEGTTRISLQPRVVEANLVGAAFASAKSFLLPSPGLIAALKGMTKLYEENPESKLVIVGHSDTAGGQSVNDELSLERAESMKAYLTDDVDAWLEWYGEGVPVDKRWGGVEDTMMLGAQPDSAELFASPEPLLAFQEARGLEPTGTVDDATRRELIKGYMSQDGTTLPEGVEVVVHGCGENFPLEKTKDGVSNEKNRRIELFFFDGEMGVQPPPPGQNSKPGALEYPEWRRRALETHEFVVANKSRKLRVRMQLRGEALGDKKYQFFVDDFLLGAGTTDAGGLIEQFVPSDAKAVRIRILDPGIDRVLELTPEEAFPSVKKLEGVQARLRHLDFYKGEVDGERSEVLDAAILQFKKAQGLAGDSKLDEPTRSALKAAYGS